MNGFEATEQILKFYKAYKLKMKHLSLPPVNIVALTSYTDKKTMDRCK